MTNQKALDFIESFSSISKLNGAKRYKTKALRQTKEFKEILRLIENIPGHEQFTVSEIVTCLQEDFNEIPRCLNCNAEIPFKIERKKDKTGYYIKKFCSLKCFNNFPENKRRASEREKKMAKTRLEKRKNTIIQKYGSLENWPGLNNFQKSSKRLKDDPIFKQMRSEKFRNTCLKKYGVSHPNKLPGEGKRRRNKADQTTLKKYGVSNIFQSTLFKENSEEFKEKAMNTCLEKYGALHYTQSLGYKEGLFNIDNYQKLSKEFIKKNFFDESDGFDLKTFCDFIGCSRTTAYKILHRFNVDWIYNSGGFDPNKPGKLYYIKHNGLYKIGITNKTLKERFGRYFKEIEIIKIWNYENGYKAYLAEQEILNAFRHYRISNETFKEIGGKTEFFETDILNLDKIKQEDEQ